jgi:hypothetical protein
MPLVFADTIWNSSALGKVISKYIDNYSLPHHWASYSTKCSYTRVLTGTSQLTFQWFEFYAGLSDGLEHRKGKVQDSSHFSIHTVWKIMCISNACLLNEWMNEWAHEVSYVELSVLVMKFIDSYVNDGYGAIILCAHCWTSVSRVDGAATLLAASLSVKSSSDHRQAELSHKAGLASSEWRHRVWWAIFFSMSQASWVSLPLFLLAVCGISSHTSPWNSIYKK